MVKYQRNSSGNVMEPVIIINKRRQMAVEKLADFQFLSKNESWSPGSSRSAFHSLVDSLM